jgi:hypothetical protein
MNILIIFSGGSGGNFLFRCLNLLDTSSNLLSIEEKFIKLNYADVGHRQLDNFHEINWVVYEQQSWDHVQNKFLDTNQIPLVHVEFYKAVMQRYEFKKIAYINPFNNVEWCILNALYKNTPANVTNIELGREILDNDLIYKIDCKNMVENTQSFLREFSKFCSFIEHTLQEKEIYYLRLLFNQWKKTTLNEENFDKFKEKVKKTGVYITATDTQYYLE